MHVSALHAEVVVEEESNREKAEISQITQYMNFVFNTNKIIAYRAYNIGRGFQLDMKTITGRHNLARLNVKVVFVNGEQEQQTATGDRYWKVVKYAQEPQTVIDNNEDEARAANATDALHGEDAENKQESLFKCPVDGCIKMYAYANLQNHLETGKHIYISERQTLRDAVIGMYQNTLEAKSIYSRFPELSEAITETVTLDVSLTYKSNMAMGWALKSQRENKNFNERQVQWLTNLFDEGQKLNKKQDPNQAATDMRHNTQLIESEFLTAKQILAFWSRLSKKRKDEAASEKNRQKTCKNEKRNGNC